MTFMMTIKCFDGNLDQLQIQSQTNKIGQGKTPLDTTYPAMEHKVKNSSDNTSKIEEKRKKNELLCPLKLS